MGKIDIKINRNETLAKKRNDIYNTLPQKDKPKYNNILFLYIDAISPYLIPNLSEPWKIQKNIVPKNLFIK